MIDTLARALRPFRVAISNLVSRGVVRVVDDGQGIQELQIGLLDTETRDQVERFQQYGFTSKPRAGAEVVVLSVGGRREHSLAIAVDDRRYRFKNLSDGEVAVYNDTGASIVIKASGDIEVTPASGKKLKVGADVEVTGTLTASVDVKAGAISLKTHTHPANLTLAGTTAASGAPLAGTASGTTGAPT